VSGALGRGRAGGAGALGGGCRCRRRRVDGAGSGVVGALDHEGRGVVGVLVVGIVDDFESVVGATDNVRGNIPSEFSGVVNVGCVFVLVWV
jgi:hypothetical protein